MGLPTPLEERYQRAITAYEMHNLEGKTQQAIANHFSVSRPTAAKLIREGEKLLAKERQSTDLLHKIHDRVDQLSAWLWGRLHNDRVSDHAKSKYAQEYNRSIEILGKVATALGAHPDGSSTKGRYVISDEGLVTNLRYYERRVMEFLLAKAVGQVPISRNLIHEIPDFLEEERLIRQQEREARVTGEAVAYNDGIPIEIDAFPDVDIGAELEAAKELRNIPEEDG
jgi:hypothetical protein